MKAGFNLGMPIIPGLRDFQTSTGMALHAVLEKHLDKELLLKHWHPKLVSVMEKVGADASEFDLFIENEIEPEDVEAYYDYAEEAGMPTTIDDVETFHRLYTSALSYWSLKGALEFERHLILTGHSPLQTDQMSPAAIDFFNRHQDDMAYIVFDCLVMESNPELSPKDAEFVFASFIQQIEYELAQRADGNKHILLEDLPEIFENMRKAKHIQRTPLEPLYSPSNRLN